MKRRTKYLVILIVFALVFGLGGGIIWLYQAVYGPNPAVSREAYAEIIITPGMILPAIAQVLEDSGLVDQAREFMLSARILHLDHRLQAGEYALPFGESNASLLFRLIHAGTHSKRLTIPEGFTAREIASLLQERIGLDSIQFMRLVFDSTLLVHYRVAAPSFEGFLFPDTYNLYSGIEPGLVLQKMVKRFYQVFDSTHQRKAAALGLSVTDAVTLASIIEGEVRQYEEGAIISSVYHNRLKKHMLLQADPTIQYVIVDKPRRLHWSDLSIDSPYNTYLHPGLPPGPVCNPGRFSLQAALNPASTPFLFMVSQGDGTHAFSTTLDAHLQAKTKLDSLRQILAAAQAQQRDTLNQ